MIPAVRIYDRSEPTSRETLLESRTIATPVYRTYELRHRTAGVTPLFRTQKLEREQWGVLFDDRSARNGRWFATEAEARAMFDRWTEEG